MDENGEIATLSHQKLYHIFIVFTMISSSMDEVFHKIASVNGI